MRPHKIHVDAGEEYNGETYIYCECLTPPGEHPVGCFGSRDPHMFDGLYEGESLNELLAFLEEHNEEKNEAKQDR